MLSIDYEQSGVEISIKCQSEAFTLTLCAFIEFVIADRRRAGELFWDNVWGVEPAIPRLAGACNERTPDFPTQLPLALLEPIVQCASEPGDLFIDPFVPLLQRAITRREMQ
jgi:hypothetical protein